MNEIKVEIVNNEIENKEHIEENKPTFTNGFKIFTFFCFIFIFAALRYKNKLFDR